jgi:uncharacterized oxidoreductase
LPPTAYRETAVGLALADNSGTPGRLRPIGLGNRQPIAHLSLFSTYCATKAAIHSYTQSLRYQLRNTSVQVLELIPPYVQTELMGSQQANDPSAMPLKDFIAEVMNILKTSPDVTEICVERVKPLRFAEANGGYNAFFQKFNEATTAARAR